MKKLLIKLRSVSILFYSILFYSILFYSVTAFANNLTITNATVATQDTSADTLTLQFDISWSNSWRDATNWDAAWVFIKYSTDAGTTWSHATLKTFGTTPTGFSAGSGTAIEIIVPTDKKGAFVQRSGTAAGALSTTSLKFVWDYGTDIAASTKDADAGRAVFRVMGIEMVYIPTGSFYVGDGTTSTVQGQFTAHNTTAAFQITGEGALTLGGSTTGNLGNNNTTGMYASDKDDFSTATTQTLPAAFPKGYNAFYLMKYETTQGQYRDFLNTLTSTQQTPRCSATTNGRFMYTDNTVTTPQYRNGIQKQAIGFVCNLDNDGTYNENTDGEWIACNYLNFADLEAYADWAGLRPMTELEFEKAARGTASAVANEYAWGTTNITNANTIANSGATNEGVTETGNGLCNYNNDGVTAPLRSGFTATSGTGRETAGAGYYGNMDLSGNLWERPVTVGNAGGRAFTGLHGDGVLTTAGEMDVTNWIVASTAEGSGFRGGGWFDGATLVRLSDRFIASYAYTDRSLSYGARLCRTSP